MTQSQTDSLLHAAKEFFESLGIQCYDIIPPINSDVYCVKRVDSQWAAYRLNDSSPVVEFGKYNHMWGFDDGLCLVSVSDADSTTFSNRGIIDEFGREVIAPYTLLNIWRFYGRHEPTILIQGANGFLNLRKPVLKLL